MHLKSKISVDSVSKWTAIFALALTVLGSCGVEFAGWAQPATRQLLPGSVPAVVATAAAIGQPLATAKLNLAIGLPLRNAEALTNLLQQLFDPASPNFRHWLTTAQFTEQFGPTAADYQALVDFVTANGMTVTTIHPNRMLLEVEAPVAVVENVFQVTIREYQHPKESRKFYAPDVAPSLPAALGVLDVGGLTDYSRPRPKYHVKSKEPLANVKPKAGTGPFGNYMGNDFRKAYAPGVSLTGSNQTIALVQFDGYLASDIKAYETLAGLPNVPLQNVLLNGFNGKPTGTGGEVEVSLDIEMVISMAPGLSKVVVYMGSPFNFNPNVVLNRIATDNSARQVSCSWGWTGGANATTEQIFLQMAAQGQSFFNASGDDDAFLPGQVDDPTYFGTPSASPNITQVGGTTLTTGSTGNWVSETVWNWGGGVGSSGGITASYGIPIWQQGINMAANHGSTTQRNIPDVALTADDVLVIADGGLQYAGVGGTSVAAPLWAGFTALVNQQAAAVGSAPVGFINPAIYAIGKDINFNSNFHDITTGDNAWSGSGGLFPAVAGYDLCTGWGTPVGQNLINALTILGTPDGILEVSITPVDGNTLVASSTQKILLQVTDGLPVTNATVSATVNGSTPLIFNNSGTAPDTTANDAFYSANLTVPASTNDLNLRIVITAPGKTNSTNFVTYSVVPVPVNDHFTNAIKVSAVGGAYLSNNKFASLESGETKHAGDTNVAASLWWNWSPTSSTNVFIDTTGSTIDTVVAVYTGPSVNNLVAVASTNDVGTSQQAYLNFNATGGTAYRICVASANSNSLGSLRLLVAPGGQRDTNAPMVLVGSPLSGTWVSNFLVTLTGTANDPTPNASGVARVLINANGQSAAATGTTNWSYTFGLRPGLNTIGVTAVDVAGNVSAPALLDVTYVITSAVNDLFANANELSGNSGTVSVATTNATKEFNEPNHAGNAGGKSVWWSFTPPADGLLTLTTTNSTFDTLLGLYTGTSVSTLTVIANNDDAYAGASRGFSALTQAVRSNVTYHVAADGFDGDSGIVALSYAFVPASVFTLTTGSAGGGQVTPASGDVVSNATVVLTAQPDAFFEFANWTGSFAGTANPLSVVVTSNLNLTAHFRPISFAEDFESGNLLGLNWTSSGNVPWVVESTNVLAGGFSARSGVITNSQTSSLLLTTNFGGGAASFYLKVSSEPNWDFFSFHVDGVLQQQWSGEVGWTSYAFPLLAGTHTLEWRYTKDANVSAGLDAAFIDNVRLPFGLTIDASTPAQLQLLRQANGSLLLQVLGQTNQQYVIQGTASLTPATVWQNLSTNIAAGGVIQYVDPGTATNPLRFYRAVVIVP